MRDPAGVVAQETRAGETLRALGAGVAVGSLLCIGNLWLGLKTGLWDSGHLTSALVAFALTSAGGRGSTRATAIALTVAAGAAAAPSAASLLAGIPALELSGAGPFPTWGAIAWGTALGALGVLLAALLRERLLEGEELPFPSGAAAAELIAALHSGAAEARGRPQWLLAASLAGGALTALRDAAGLIPGGLGTPFVGVALSPLLVGVGAIVGVRTALSLLVGSLLAFGAGARLLLRAGVLAQLDYNSAAEWLAWPGVGLLVGSAAFSLVADRRAFAGAVRDLFALRGDARRALAGALVLCVAAAFLAHRLYAMSLPGAIAGLLVAAILTMVCARTTGRADVAPIGQLAQLAQGAFALFGRALDPTSLGAPSLSAGPASQASSTLWSLQAGRKLGVPVRAQLGAALFGSAFGALLAAPAYRLLLAARPLGGPDLPAPSAVQWLALAKVVAQGASALPRGAVAAVTVALAAGALLEALQRTRAAKLLPIPVALGLGALLPPSASAAMALGAVAVWLVVRKKPARADDLAAAGAGAIAGESVVGTLIALLVAAGVLRGG